MRKNMKKIVLSIAALLWGLVMLVSTIRTEQSYITSDEHKQLLTQAKELSTKEVRKYGYLPLSEKDRFAYYASPVRVNDKLTVQLNIITRKVNDEDGEKIEKVWLSTDPDKLYNNDVHLKIISKADGDAIVVVGQYTISSYDGKYSVENRISYGGNPILK